ncbi:hypothetical protein [Streptomyces sp.]|uniref:hypothetical protein n=1 Tax=Streptomyces sp. TaxID=1931 RepID=UPI002D77CA4E|nr:hypothetical protein [Streptomyces sp.]HET6359184.1 hypothetical protein [Streptomyces sp.]
MKRRIDARQSKATQSLIAELENSLKEFSLPPASRKMRALLRARYYRSWLVPIIGLLCAFFTLSWIDAIIMNYIKGDAQRTYIGFTPSTIQGWNRVQSGDFRSLNEAITSPVLRTVLEAASWTAIQLIPPVLAYRTAMGQRWSLSKKTRLFRRYSGLDGLAHAVTACAKVRRATVARRPDAMRELAKKMRGVEEDILSLHRYSDQLPARSHRKRALKKHAQLVVSQLRNAETHIDEEGNIALAPLACLLMKISNRSIEGRLGALLDEADFDTGLTPVHDWEPLRLAVSAVLLAGCAVGVGLLSLPDGIDTYVIGGCGVAILTLVFGRRVHSLLGLLNTIRGG